MSLSPRNSSRIPLTNPSKEQVNSQLNIDSPPADGKYCSLPGTGRCFVSPTRNRFRTQSQLVLLKTEWLLYTYGFPFTYRPEAMLLETPFPFTIL